MVEGPQCRLKAKRLQRLRGQRIVRARGRSLSASDAAQLEGAAVERVLS
eukprot:SAG31_NODE_16187_length_719_cov_1.574194_2_plen_48_part_01